MMISLYNGCGYLLSAARLWLTQIACNCTTICHDNNVIITSNTCNYLIIPQQLHAIRVGNYPRPLCEWISIFTYN